MNKFIEKVRRHLSWEFFWQYLAWTGGGIIFVVYSVINFNELGILKFVGFLLFGILFITFGIWRMMTHYRKM